MQTRAKTKQSAPPPKLTPTYNGLPAPELVIHDLLNVIEFDSLKPGEDVDATVIDAYTTLLTIKVLQMQKEYKKSIELS